MMTMMGGVTVSFMSHEPLFKSEMIQRTFDPPKLKTDYYSALFIFQYVQLADGLIMLASEFM